MLVRALAVMGIDVVLGVMSLPQMMYAYGIIFVATGMLIYPFLSNVLHVFGLVFPKYNSP